MSNTPMLSNPLERLADFNDLISAKKFVVTCEIAEQNNRQLYLTFKVSPGIANYKNFYVEGDFIGAENPLGIINDVEVLTCICLKSPFKLTVLFYGKESTLSIVFKPTNVNIIKE